MGTYNNLLLNTLISTYAYVFNSCIHRRTNKNLKCIQNAAPNFRGHSSHSSY